MGDLAGILVVAIEQAVAAPYASSRLADAGARVIKVERDVGDFARGYDAHAKGESAYFVWLNRGKESIALDLKAADDLALLRAMIAKADVVIANLAPGALERLGLGLDGLRAADHRLITCSISGYGEEGARAHQKAYDLLVQAESGLASINGSPDEPARVGVSVCDIAAGMAAHSAILQALFARERSGEGRHIAVSLFGAMADWMNVPMMQHRYGGAAPKRMGLRHPTIAPYGVFDCADGKPLLISVQNEREWAKLCIALGDATLPTRAGFRDNNERVANREAVDGFVAAGFAREGREAVAARMEDAGIAYGRLNDLDDLVAHPQARWVSVEAGEGTIELLAPPAVVNGTLPTLRAVPRLDEQGAALRDEFAASRS